MSIRGAESLNRPRIRTYTCNRCDDTACECSTEDELPPTHCCKNFIPAWRLS